MAGDENLYRYTYNSPAVMFDNEGEAVWVAAGALLGGAVNLASAYAASDGDFSFRQGAAAFAGGAVSGAIGSLAGPFAGSIALRLGAMSNGLLSAALTGVLSGAGSYTGQVLSNSIDPCHAADPVIAAIMGASGGLLAGLMPTNTMNTVRQAIHFSPRRIMGLFRSRNSAWFWGATASSAAIGSSSNMIDTSILVN